MGSLSLLQGIFPTQGSNPGLLHCRWILYKLSHKGRLVADDMILYIENPKHTTRKLLELINEYGKVARYKINTQKSPAFLYTSNEKTERETEEQSYSPLQ